APRIQQYLGGARGPVSRVEIRYCSSFQSTPPRALPSQQRDVVGISGLAVEAAARGLGACDAFLLLADLATRQMFKGRGRNVGWGNIIGPACARAGERGEAGGKACAKAHDFARSGCGGGDICMRQLTVQVRRDESRSVRCQDALMGEGQKDFPSFLPLQLAD